MKWNCLKYNLLKNIYSLQIYTNRVGKKRCLKYINIKKQLQDNCTQITK